MAARTSRRRAVAAAGAVLLLGVVATACSGGSGGDSSAGEPAAVTDRYQAKDPPGVAAPGTGSAATPGANRTVVRVRAQIKTGEVTLTSRHLDAARAQVDGVLARYDGTVDAEQTTHARNGSILSSVLTLRVPVASFEDAVSALEKVGTMKTSDSRSKDVTTQVIDVRERVATLRTSLERLHRFQKQTANIDDLIRFEQEITQREAELQSLVAQRDYLADQTTLSTITVTMLRPEKYVAPPDPLKDAGFWSGLKAGWGALVDTVVVALTVVGAVLPFAAVLALVGVPVWLLLRRALRARRTPPAAPAES